MEALEGGLGREEIEVIHLFGLQTRTNGALPKTITSARLSASSAAAACSRSDVRGFMAEG